MSVNARTQEILVGFSKSKQADIATANTAAGIWRLNKLNADYVSPKWVTEDDAPEFGKGHEFPTATFPSHVEVGPFNLEKYLSAEIMAWAAAFGLGACTKTGAGPYTYTCTPLAVTSGLELSYLTYVEQIRPASGTLLDRAYVGCALNSFMVDILTGPGRGSSKITMEILGSGKMTDPSTITLPAATAEHLLPASSLALTIIGVDYVTLKDIVSLQWGYNNGMDGNTGFYPGSGSQDTNYAKRGRLEVGTRAATLKFVVRMHASSAEYTKLKASTTGTAVITQTFSADETYTATFQQVAFRVVEIGDTGGLVTLSVECSPQYHSSNGLLSITAKTAVNGIMQAE